MQRWGDLFDSQAGSSVMSRESRQLEDCFFSSMACVGVEATATCSHGPAGMTAISFADRRLTDPSSATSVGPAALLPCCERPGPLPPPPPPAACPCTGPTTSPPSPRCVSLHRPHYLPPLPPLRVPAQAPLPPPMLEKAWDHPDNSCFMWEEVSSSSCGRRLAAPHP